MTNNPLEHRKIRTRRNTWHHKCDNCMYEFTMGDERHEWRLHTTSVHYGSGMYWTTNCEKCFVENIVKWRDMLTEEIDSMPQSMRELA